MLCSVEASEVLDADEILANNVEEEGRGDDWAGETEEHPDSEVNSHPDIVVHKSQPTSIP